MNEPFNAGRAGGVQKHLGAEDVRLHKDGSAENASVHVRLGGKMDDRIDRVLPERRKHGLGIANVAANKAVPRVTRDILEVLEISRVRQNIKIDDADVGVRSEKIMNEIRPDEPGAARNEDCLHVSPGGRVSWDRFRGGFRRPALSSSPPRRVCWAGSPPSRVSRRCSCTHEQPREG